MARKKESKDFQNFVNSQPAAQIEEVFVVTKHVIVAAFSLTFVKMKPEEKPKTIGELQHLVIHPKHCENPKRGWFVPSFIVIERDGECLFMVLNPTYQSVQFYPGEEIVTSERMTKKRSRRIGGC